MDNVYRLHGMPSSIVSDRDRIFTSSLWKELFSLAKVELRMSSAYNPQSDGQMKRVNQCMETFLRCFTHSCPKKWSNWLSLAEFWYNTSLHSAMGRSPFKALYDHSPRYFGLSLGNKCFASNLNDWLQERAVMTTVIKQHLHRASLRMKHQSDKGRSHHQFAVGILFF